MRILIVEDDEVLRSGLHTGLELEGFTADTVADCESAEAAVSANHFDAVVLDIGLPDGSGLDLLSSWRHAGRSIPVILLTARNLRDERIRGLNVGADDYVGKPFDLGELSARLRTIHRRASGRSTGDLQIGKLSINEASRTVTLSETDIPLSRREYAILHALAQQPGRILSRHDLECRLYGWQEEIESNAIEVHIHNLRSKLGRTLIQTVRGQGYRMPLP